MTPEQAIEAWENAKRIEAQAREQRIEAEQALIDALGCKAEGSQTHTVGDRKVTIQGKMNRCLDENIWQSIARQVPEELRPVKYKAELDMKGVRYLMESHPDVWAMVANAVITTPGKPYVTIKRTDER